MVVKSIIPPTTKRSRMESRWMSRAKQLPKLAASQFDLSTILMIGGLLQGTLLLLIPRVWVLLPTLIVLVARFAKTIAITLQLMPNPQMKDAILQRTTVVIPDTDGEFNKDGAANEKVAVLLLGLRINHPLGYFAPGMAKIGELNEKMQRSLDKEASNNGFLGQSTWNKKSEHGSEEIMLISYWRSIEDIHNFAVGPTHKEAWSYWNSNIADLKHVGISHEVFQADKAMYESVYVNFQPTRLGATTFLRKGDELLGGTVPDTWISPLVDASRGKLRSSKGRLGWSTEDDREKLMAKHGYHY